METPGRLESGSEACVELRKVLCALEGLKLGLGSEWGRPGP